MSETPPRSMGQLAEELGVDRDEIKARLPELYKRCPQHAANGPVSLKGVEISGVVSGKIQANVLQSYGDIEAFVLLDRLARQPEDEP